MRDAAVLDSLIAEAVAAPVDGWGFAWLDGRAIEERPSWGYSGLLVQRVEQSSALLDVQTGGAEVITEVLDRAAVLPSLITATESWAPNLVIARSNLKAHHATVTNVADRQAFPFKDAAFDLISSRHPVATRWDEIARVPAPGGQYFAQHIGAGTNRELTDFIMGPQPVSDVRSAARASREAKAAGLELSDLREETLRVEFHDIGAVVYFLRKVLWTVPDFTVARYLDRLARMHEQIRNQG